MACLRRVSISELARVEDASVARMPWGRDSNAFCSLEALRLLIVRLMGLPSARFLGRPRSIIDASDSPLRWPMV
jgi:hypothetical protein